MRSFSIIIPVYNTIPVFINRAIESVMKQNSTLEIIVVNDGSTNKETLDCLNEISCYERVNYISLEKNVGLAEALNVGLRNAKNEWICFLDCDDFYGDFFLEDFESIIGKNKDLEVITGGYVGLNSNNEVLYIVEGKDNSSDIYDHLFSCVRWTRCYKRTFLEHYSIDFPTGCNCEDLAFTINVFSKAKYITTQMHRIGYNYWINDSSLSHSKKFQSSPLEKLPFNYLKNIVAYINSTPSESGYACLGSIAEVLIVLCCSLSTGTVNKELERIVKMAEEVVSEFKEIKTVRRLWRKFSKTSREMKILTYLFLLLPNKSLYLFIVNRAIRLWKSVR